MSGGRAALTKSEVDPHALVTAQALHEVCALAAPGALAMEVGSCEERFVGIRKVIGGAILPGALAMGVGNCEERFVGIRKVIGGAIHDALACV